MMKEAMDGDDEASIRDDCEGRKGTRNDRQHPSHSGTTQSVEGERGSSPWGLLQCRDTIM